ncbi:MAG: GTP cyclohydrolase, FolE2/MptA family [Thermoplasmataceae archaeon]
MNKTGRKIPQDYAPHVNLPIGNVGVDGYKTPIELVFGGKRTESIATVSVSVDLPAQMRGAHFSSMLDSVISGIGRPVEDTLEIVRHIARLVLKRNPYSKHAVVKIEATYLRELEGTNKMKSYVPYKIEYSSESRSDGTEINSFVLGTTIFTACPCTMEGTRSILAERYPDQAGFLSKIPTVTHSQRNRLSVTISNFRTYVPEPDRIIELIESVSGGPLASVQTDKESDMFVLRGHENPRFVEDVARDIAKAICKGIDKLEGDAIIRITSRSEESLHNHDAFADIELTADEIRKYS